LRRFLIAAALAAALFSPAVLAPTDAAAQSCYGNTYGSTTYTSCYGPDGSYSSSTSQRAGSSTNHHVSGIDANGEPFSGWGTTTGTRNSSWTTWTITEHLPGS
jgi:uncharacterized membrane protein